MTINTSKDCDLISSFFDLGPLGTKNPVELKIPYGLYPGSILFITARCENYLCIKLKDDLGSIVQNLDIRLRNNKISIKDQCSIVKEETDEKPEIFDNIKGRFSLTCVCETKGYRIFINGNQTEFFNRPYVHNASLLYINNCQIYKIMYTTIIFDKNKEDEVVINKSEESQEDKTKNNSEINKNQHNTLKENTKIDEIEEDKTQEEKNEQITDISNTNLSQENEDISPTFTAELPEVE